MRMWTLAGSAMVLLSAGVVGTWARGQTVTPDAPSAMLKQAQATASLSGTVMDVGGTPVESAEVTLTSESTEQKGTTTDELGVYHFTGLAAAEYTLSVKAQGLADGEQKVTVGVGAAVTAPDMLLKLATVNTEVTAVSQKEMADIQLKQEETQRVLGVIPNFYEAFDKNTVPLTQGQKAKLAWRSLIDPVTFAMVGLNAGINQATKTPVEWRENWEGYGQRFGAQLGGTAAGTALAGYVFPAIFHQDPRYFYKGEGTFKERANWALKQSVEQKNDKGYWEPGYSNMLGDVTSSVVTTAIYPHENTAWGKTIAVDFVLSLAGDAFSNLMEEFVVPKLTLHKKTPVQQTP